VRKLLLLLLIIIIIIIITGQKHWYKHVPKSAVTNQGDKVTTVESASAN